MAVLKIYNDIQTESDKTIARYWGDVEGVCYKDIDEFCESIPEDDNIIDIRLFCDGGSCTEGWAIYDRLRATGKEISCTVEGKAASMATVILMAAPKERRKAYNSAMLCVHNPWMPSWGLDYSVTADDLQKAADELRVMQNKMLDLYVERCGCDRDEMQALMDEDKYIGTDKALELGLIGEVIAPVSAKKMGAYNNKKQYKKAMSKNEKTDAVKAGMLDRVLSALGIKSVAEFAVGMDLSTADGDTITVEREDGEPQVGDKASPDGEFLMPDGSTIVVKDGAITEIKDNDDSSNGNEKDDKVAELEKEIEALKEQVESLTAAKAKAESMAKTVEEMRILNAVKIAGGEKALAQISSSYKPNGRVTTGTNATQKTEEHYSPMRREIEARRNGEFNNKKEKNEQETN